MHLAAGHVGRQRGEMELGVGRGAGRIDAAEQAALVDAHRQGPAAEQQPLQPHRGAAVQRAQLVVGGDGAARLVDEADLQVVLQVLAHAGQVAHHADAEAPQQRGRAHARQLQQLRRLQRAGAQDHLAAGPQRAHLAVLAVAHAAGAAALKQHRHCVRAGLDTQVGAAARRPQIGHRGGAAAAIAGGELVVAHPFLVAAVEVGHVWQAERARRADQAFDQRMRRLDRGGVQRTFGAARGARAEVVVLELAEVGQAFLPAPARVAGGGPGIVVLALAADVDQAVDGAGAAQRAAARPVDAAVQHVGVGFGVVAPVQHLVEHGLAVADGDVDPGRAVRWPRLQQAHAVLAVGAQAVRQHAAGGTGPHHDVVHGIGHVCFLLGLALP
ncbi:Uncharacterised protein [Achromobacter xylosoxidans]|nr:Uncharacterised protein [Achromobacter xylosoxidans]